MMQGQRDETGTRRSRGGVTRLSAAILLGMAVFIRCVSASEDASPRISLLSSGTRASIVIELDGSGAKATAIEATDNHSIAVEIGPVQGKVANQRLQAAAGSQLVSEVRVRGVTQGTEGTIITIQVLAKAPITGSVRRAQQRVYIDLERREPLGPGSDRIAAAPAAPAAGEVASEAAARSAPKTARTTAVKPAAALVSPPPAPVAPRTAAPQATARPSPAAAEAEPAPASVVPVLPRPRAASGALTPTSAPSTSTPGIRPAASAPAPPVAASSLAAVATVSAATPAPATAARPNAPSRSADDLLAKSADLARQSDVKGLERLKETAVARLGRNATEADASHDPLVSHLDRLLNDARQQRLLSDSKLFQGEAGAAPGNASAQAVARPVPGTAAGAAAEDRSPSTTTAPALQAATSESQPADDPLDLMLSQVMPDIERMKETLLSWQPGYLASPGLPPQIEELNAKLRSLHPPAPLLSPLSGLTSALSDLSSTWVPGPDGKLIPFRDDARAVERTKNALTAFMDAAAAMKLSSGR